jgi:signal transduction histidine kinase
MILPFNRAGKIMNHYLVRQETEQANKYANKLEENAVRLSGTLNNLLYWSSQQLEGYIVKPSAFEVRELVNEVVGLFEELIRLKDITIHNAITPGDQLYTDREAFHVIIRNLLSNAVKYTEHGSIYFSSGLLGEDYFVEIKDEGIGMDQERVNSLQNGVLQESKSGTLGEKGSGLGFSIIKKLAVAIKADYKINSESGKGTGVRIIFKKERA